MKKGFKKIIIFVGFVLVLMTVIFVIISRLLMGTEIKLNEEKIPSLYEVTKKTGVYKVETSGGDIITEKLYYKEGSIDVENLNEYINYLVDFGFITTKDFVNNNGQLGKVSKDNGKIILIDLKYSENGSVIKYTKKIGRL